MVASFLHRIFRAPNVRVMSQADLTERLEDELFALRQRVGTQAFPREALEYINDWARPIHMAEYRSWASHSNVKDLPPGRR